MQGMAYYIPTFVAAPRKPAVELEYILKSEEKALTFQITNQSQAITDFLKKNRFLASNGLVIAVDEFPEFKDSTNHLYLRGSDSFRDFKLDVTYFYSNKVRDGKKTIIDQALKELVKFVQAQVNAQHLW
jgi:hypothetical protein